MKKRSAAWFLASLTFVACGTASPGGAPAAQPSDDSGDQLQRIDCHVAYNPHKGGKSADLSVIAEGSQKDSVRFGQMSMRISYFDDGFESPAFNAVVKSTRARKDISARLYQLERTNEQQGAQAQKPKNEFVGGHGFTGLAFEFDTDSRAQLQYFCEAF